MIPQDARERIARALTRDGSGRLVPVSICHTERGAQRVARKYDGAEVRPSDDGATWTVWAVRRG